MHYQAGEQKDSYITEFPKLPNSFGSNISYYVPQEKYKVGEILESECLVPTARTPACSSGSVSQIFLPRVTEGSKRVAVPHRAQITEHDDSLQCTADQGALFQQHIKNTGNFICWFCGVLSLRFPVHTGICGSR